MALREQPYLPLYVQDFLTDEKLIECSAESTGVYIRLMCILHKSDEYGCILLKQKDKQTSSNIKNFAIKLSKQMPYDLLVIEKSLKELISEKVLIMEGDILYQKRMRKDGNLSDKRSRAGKKGASKKFASNFAKAKNEANIKAKVAANTENEIEIENEYEINIKRLVDYIQNKFNFVLTGTPIEMNTLKLWLDKKIDINVIRYAFEEAQRRNINDINYVNKIVENRLEETKETKEEIKEEELPKWWDSKIEKNTEGLEELDEILKEFNEE